MDLKDVVKKVREEGDEAERAYRAGHPTKCCIRFKNIMESIRAYFNQMSPAEVAELKETTTKIPDELVTAKQEQDPGESAQPAPAAGAKPDPMGGQGFRGRKQPL